MAGERYPRPFTVQLRGPADLSFLELAESLWDQFGPDQIRCCQPWGQGRFQISFVDQQSLSRIVEHGLLLRNARVFVQPLESPPVWVSIRNAPFEMPESRLVSALAPFGEVLAHEFEYPLHNLRITNGTRRVRIRMSRPVPNLFRVGPYLLQCTYPGVVHLCRRCHFSGHFARDCCTPFCPSCRSWGHDVKDCAARPPPTDFPPLRTSSWADVASSPVPRAVHVLSPESVEVPVGPSNPTLVEVPPASSMPLPSVPPSVPSPVESPVLGDASAVVEPPPSFPSVLSPWLPSADPPAEGPLSTSEETLTESLPDPVSSAVLFPTDSYSCSDPEGSLVIDMCGSAAASPRGPDPMDFVSCESSASSAESDCVSPGFPRRHRGKHRRSKLFRSSGSKSAGPALP